VSSGGIQQNYCHHFSCVKLRSVVANGVCKTKFANLSEPRIHSAFCQSLFTFWQCLYHNVGLETTCHCLYAIESYIQSRRNLTDKHLWHASQRCTDMRTMSIWSHFTTVTFALQTVEPDQPRAFSAIQLTCLPIFVATAQFHNLSICIKLTTGWVLHLRRLIHKHKNGQLVASVDLISNFKKSGLVL
jgi:hypothetical protein